jgi:CRP-like cAMP-binding protein
MKALIASALAEKIGYLQISDFPSPGLFEKLPTRSFSPNKIIRCSNELLLVKRGLVEIWHKHHDLFIKAIPEGILFGDMPLLGQTMLVTQAITGPVGATVVVLDIDRVKEVIRKHPLFIFEKLGPRLSTIEMSHFSSQFQTVVSRVAALLLDLAGEKEVVEKLSQSELSRMLGIYRETTTNVIQVMKAEKLVEVQRKKIRLLDKNALRVLSEL